MTPSAKGVALLVLLFAAPVLAQSTIWLVRPLYPGQEALVEKTERALDKLMPGAARKEALIGSKELSAALKGKSVDELACFSADTRCSDPIDDYVAALGFERIVLIQGGQDESGFKYRVAAFEPKTGKVTPASATNAVLEKALLGAVAKVVPAASTLDVTSTPSGATVYVDDVKVGTTPLSTQVLPGERMVKLDLKLHQPIEELVVIPIRGAASVERTLEKVAARIVITASPAGASIFLDGESIGKDRVDRGIAPGVHSIRLTAENHKAFEQSITVRPDEQYVLDKTLEPLPGTGAAMLVVTRDGTGQMVKVVTELPPLTPTEETYKRQAYLQGGFEMGWLDGASMFSQRFGDDGTARTARILNRGCTNEVYMAQRLVGDGATGACRTQDGTALIGGSLEVGIMGAGNVGKFLGLSIFGVQYQTNLEDVTMEVGWRDGTPLDSGRTNRPEPPNNQGVARPFVIKTRMHLITFRPLHPVVRISAWRFQFHLGGGFEFRLGGIIEPKNALYEDGFFTFDMLLTAKAQARLYIADGFYWYGGGWFARVLPWLNSNIARVGIGPNLDDAASDRIVRSERGAFGITSGFGYGFN